ncbi:ABC transporter ATP-binding protein [Nocardioides bizhenqiangii]|uniref:ATP-binding cassette domain-containing protein n=1 Tax=Nocardioides bizhenqiangii TaxID=3095076 RepID=A0ABZ0ZUV6_9ACTN|nr:MULTISPECIES: ATP-binding cassette domain-containing protein [unclassified Nocardioides]MDZ5623402.1 ATP-binding cassette domain-containing protein [Nocardioides sp. HM23]WQQ27726.1 ATP-binding cassette domain-containing protein [Nocardioides sp. HM61]
MITVDRLTKAYGSFRAVDDVSFVCQQGRVTGFLGPNGAGKTTTMRVMAGLTNATSGRVTIGGLEYAAIPNPGRHVGVLLDASAQHGGRTGREILALGALAMGLPSDRVDEMLALVGLSEVEAKRRMRNYSLGMKQRLGIAHALLGDPEVLILDEPANGLDPAGIRWMRGLLKSYADRGGTVLLSSHLLNEVELIADEMILIGHGRIVAQGDKKSLLAGAQGAATSLVMSLDNTGLATELAQRGHLVDPVGDGLKVNAPTDEVGRAALAAGIVLTDLRTGGVGLEDLFLELTSATARDGAGAVPPPPPPATPHGVHVPPTANMPPVDSPLTPPGGHR